MLLLKSLLESRRLAKRISASMVKNHGWVIRKESPAHLTLELIDGNSEVIYSASIVPGCVKRLCLCNKVRLMVMGGEVKLGPLATIRLRNAMNYFVARLGNEQADKHKL